MLARLAPPASGEEDFLICMGDYIARRVPNEKAKVIRVLCAIDCAVKGSGRSDIDRGLIGAVPAPSPRARGALAYF